MTHFMYLDIDIFQNADQERGRCKDYQPGFTRKGQGYDPARDNRNMNKELLLLKGEPSCQAGAGVTN